MKKNRVSTVLGSLGRRESEHPIGCGREKWPRPCLPPLKSFCEPTLSSEAQHRFYSVGTVREEASPWFLALVMVTYCPSPRPCVRRMERSGVDRGHAKVMGGQVGRWSQTTGRHSIQGRAQSSRAWAAMFGEGK